MSFMGKSLAVLVVLVGCSHVINGQILPLNECIDTSPVTDLDLSQIVGEWYISAFLGSPLGTLGVCGKVTISNVLEESFDLCITLIVQLLFLAQVEVETCATATLPSATSIVDGALFLLSNVISTLVGILLLPIEGLLGIQVTDYVNYLVLTVCSLVDSVLSGLILTRVLNPPTDLINTALSASALGGLIDAELIIADTGSC